MFFGSRKLLKLAQEEIMLLQSELHLSQLKLQDTSTNLQELTTKLDTCLIQAGDLQKENTELKTRYARIINLDSELENSERQLNQSKLELDTLKEKYTKSLILFEALEKRIHLYTDTLDLTEYGLYQPKFSFEHSQQYQLELEHVYQQEKKLIADGAAVHCGTEWQVGGSLSEGRKMTKQYSKLMLYGFNGECDANIAKVKWNNVAKIEQRIRDAFTTINKLGQSHNISISIEFLQLKLRELSLTYEYEQKKYEEKEEQRRIREQMKEEERAQKEFERAQKEAEDEERKVEKDLEKTRRQLQTAEGDTTINELNEKIKLLEKSLEEAHEKKERAISMAQLTKVGHIYVISNIGSFGEDVYKIGLTRRLDPQDRIRELGDASVPFQFDVHAVIYSENAPQLEYELHQQFKDRRLNRVNFRKEFFRVTLDEIENFVNKHTNAEIVFTKLAEAREYRETLSLIDRLQNLNTIVEKELEFPKSLA
ncbi:DUF4041 domain-containing protein [Chitinophaga lutea]